MSESLHSATSRGIEKMRDEVEAVKAIKSVKRAAASRHKEGVLDRKERQRGKSNRMGREGHQIFGLAPAGEGSISHWHENERAP